MQTLDEIDIQLPDTSKFESELLTFLGTNVEKNEDSIVFPLSNTSYLPNITMTFGSSPVAQVSFNLGDKTHIIPLINKTGIERKSNHAYQPVEINEIMMRLPEMQVIGTDHLGVNLPWFDGLHPDIQTMRKTLAKSCLYHTFPSGEYWDFILPGTTDETHRNIEIDYQQVRRPKFELVSFNKCSTPLIQLEILVNTSFNKLKSTFPEGIPVDEVRQVWLYIQNPFKVDFCIVLNENSESDWAGIFKDSRLL